LRRQEHEVFESRHLPEAHSFHPNRNQARKLLSTLVHVRFRHLVEALCQKSNEDIPTFSTLLARKAIRPFF
jgi:hypothetical protein